MKKRLFCLLLACLLTAAVFTACAAENAAEMTAVNIDGDAENETNGTQAAETTEATESTEAPENTETTEVTDKQRDSTSKATEAPTEEPTEAPTEASSEAYQPPVESQEPATEATEATEAPVDLRTLAGYCIGGPVSNLYSAIGYPPYGSSYATSCNSTEDVPAEDGELYYEGFTVYTFRVGDEETVVSIYP